MTYEREHRLAETTFPSVTSASGRDLPVPGVSRSGKTSIDHQSQGREMENPVAKDSSSIESFVTSTPFDSCVDSTFSRDVVGGGDSVRLLARPATRLCSKPVLRVCTKRRNCEIECYRYVRPLRTRVTPKCRLKAIDSSPRNVMVNVSD